jgi:hypothetical protein
MNLIQHTPRATVSTMATLKVIPKLWSFGHRDHIQNSLYYAVLPKHYQTEIISTVKSFFRYRGLNFLLSYKQETVYDINFIEFINFLWMNERPVTFISPVQ